MTQLLRLSDYRRSNRRVYFNRSELSQLLALYSSRVSTGEWRDYAIDHSVGAAIFSIFRHTHDRPLFSIVKFGGVGGRPADYALFTGRRRLKRAGSLADILPMFDRKLKIITDT